MPTESQLRDARLRARIRHLIELGAMPVVQPERIAAGYGLGKKCDACDEPIRRDQIEYEVDDDRFGARLGLHFRCYVLWQRDCVEWTRERRRDQPLPAVAE